MKIVSILLLITGTLVFQSKLKAQSYSVSSISLVKETVSIDSVRKFNINVAIDLSDTTSLVSIICKIKGVTTDSVYRTETYQIPNIEDVFVGRIMKDQKQLFINMGDFILSEPVLLETEFIDRNNNHSYPYITNE